MGTLGPKYLVYGYLDPLGCIIMRTGSVAQIPDSATDLGKRPTRDPGCGFHWRAIGRALESPVGLRVVLSALVMGPFDSGGVCSMGPYLVCGILLVCIRVQARGPY